MKRLIVTAPASIAFDQLNTDQVLGLQAVMANYVQPMPGTKPHDDQIIIDCVMKDNFDPQAITDLELPFIIIGYWSWDGSSAPVEIEPLAPGFINFLPDRVTHDEQGDVVSTLPPVFHLPHAWAGWPTLEV